MFFERGESFFNETPIWGTSNVWAIFPQLSAKCFGKFGEKTYFCSTKLIKPKRKGL